jgi:hypothetical protein
MRERYVHYCNDTIVIITNMLGNLIIVGVDYCRLVHSCIVKQFKHSILGCLVLGKSLNWDVILNSRGGLVSG